MLVTLPQKMVVPVQKYNFDLIHVPLIEMKLPGVSSFKVHSEVEK
jgi:hypothetical protein